MYKLLVFFVFFSLLANGQAIPPVNNQNNSNQIEEKSNMKIQTQSLSRKDINVQLKSFELNVYELQSELKMISTSSIRKSPTLFQQQQMQLRLNEIEQINNQSFEYHLLNYQVGNYDFSKINSLKAAEKLKPNDVTVLKEFSAYSYIKNDIAELNKYLQHLNSMRAFSKDLELYAINVLHSLPSNSVLISHGEQDTYPLLIQQKLNNVRNDVEIISLDHLQSDEYRKRLKKQGYNIPKKDVIDTQFFDEFMKLNSDKYIVVAVSVPKSYLEKGKNLQNVGLGFSFENKASNAAKSNLIFFENSLKSKINQHISISKNGQLLGNYLPFLFDVRNSYILKKDFKSIDEIEKMIRMIGQKSNKTEQIKALLNK
jgi:hypothetical protein